MLHRFFGTHSKTPDWVFSSQERVHRRYLSGICTLVQVLRLLTPSVQVDIADKQVKLRRMAQHREPNAASTSSFPVRGHAVPTIRCGLPR
jgi:hypothetical protein